MLQYSQNAIPRYALYNYKSKEKKKKRKIQEDSTPQKLYSPQRYFGLNFGSLGGMSRSVSCEGC